MKNSCVLSGSITHSTNSIIDDQEQIASIVATSRKRLQDNPPKEISLEKALDLLNQLSEFDLGRFLLKNKSFNGYWTSYVFRNEKKNSNPHPLETWYLEKSMIVNARERFHRFKSIVQSHLHSDMNLASIPCGVMDDLLDLDYSKVNNISLTGIDIDQESLNYAKENAQQYELDKYLELIQRDAWNLGIENAFDLIVSNGLNMYEANTEKLVCLYKNFYNSLKAGGLLVISFLPPPPDGTNPTVTWDQFGIDSEDLKLERTILIDILQVNFLKFCTEKEMINQLTTAGFLIQEIQYNSKGILPIIIAKK